MMLRLLLVAMLALLAVGTVGLHGAAVARAQDDNKTCAGEPMIGAGGAKATPAGGPPPVTADPASKAGKALNIAFLPKDIVNPYFKTAQQGAEQAAKELGGKFQEVGPQTSNAAEQVTYIQTLTQQKVDAIVVSANDTNALSPALKQAAAQGIKVISYDSDVAPDARIAFANQADSEAIGRVEVQIMGKLLKCQGDIAILSAASTMTNQNTWIGYMK